jgi:hypothetical protein
MKRIVRLTESDLKKIVRRVINESLGINEEAKKLADLITQHISGIETNRTIVLEDNIDILNIKKIIINRISRGFNPYFDHLNSKTTEEGSTLIFGLRPKEDYSTILHESFHGVDFIYKKGKFSDKLPYFRRNTNTGLSGFLNLALFTPKHAFGLLLYLLSDEEVKSRLHDVYADGTKYYKTLIGSKEEKRKKLFEYINNENYLFTLKGGLGFVRFSDFYELLNKLSKETLQELTYGYYNENGENTYTRLLGILNHYFKMKPKFETVTDQQIEKFKKEVSKQLESGHERFRKGLGRIVMLIEKEQN